jgi:hypothetical protein
VTVCIAALCKWNYAMTQGQLDVGSAILTMSDRMITVGDTEYEPSQQKFGMLASSVVLIAGDYSVHSQAVIEARKVLAGAASSAVYDIAKIYGHCIQRIKLQIAENHVLAPLGLNTDSFIAQQRELAPELVERLSVQLQHHGGEPVEAIVAGVDNGSPHLYYVDNQGTPHCFDDVGFAAIGVGAWHARSRLMQFGYVNTLPVVRALALAYTAKKAAEVAPGVGKTTDIHIIFRTGVETLLPAIQTKLDELYVSYEKGCEQLATGAVTQLSEFFATHGKQLSNSQAIPKVSSPTVPEPQPSQSVPGPLE